MKTEIKVPSMGESISEATIGTIIKPSGSVVKIDDEILELETDKVNQVLYASKAGTVGLNVKQGDVVSIGQVIGNIEETVNEKEAVEKPKQPTEPKAPPPPSPKTQPTEPKSPPPPPKAQPTPPTPPKKIEVAETKSAEKEIEKPKETPIAAPKVSTGERVETRRKMSKIRKIIAQRLVEAQQTTAMLTTFNEVDMSQVIALRENHKDAFIKKFGVKLGFMSFFVEATVAALRAYPDLNSYIEGDEIVHREYYDIGIAVGTEKGLFVPVLRNCDTLTFSGIESAIEEYAKKAKNGTITADDLKGGGFTITNGGVYGSLLSTPILNPPQSGILGMHKIEKRPVVVNDQIVIRPMMYVALSYDHRIVDGKEAVSFLVLLKQMLEDPSRLLFEL